MYEYEYVLRRLLCTGIEMKENRYWGKEVIAEQSLYMLENVRRVSIRGKGLKILLSVQHFCKGQYSCVHALGTAEEMSCKISNFR